jgi:hypothetical protein
MVDCSSPSLAESYNAIRGKSIDWVVVGYDGNKLVVQHSGLDISKLMDNLDDGQCQYGMAKIKYKADADEGLGFSDDVREKYVFFTFAGPNASALKRGKMSVHKADLKKTFRDFAVEIQATSKDELCEENMLKLVKRVNY